jgi:DNA-directed RNA polymerase subunit RPC12/RpoP
MAFILPPGGDEEDFDEDEEPGEPYFPHNLSKNDTLSKTACKYCGSLMFNGIVIVNWKVSILIKGIKCVNCSHESYSEETLKEAKKTIRSTMGAEYVRNHL